MRAGMLVAAVGLFGFTCLERKLAHLFEIVYPIAIVWGGGWWLRHLGRGLMPQNARVRKTFV